MTSRAKLTLIVLFLMVQYCTAHNYLLWVGCTQTCKSTCIKQLTENSQIEVGNSTKWESTTSDITIYKENTTKLAQNYYHIDTIGFGDNRLTFTDEQIREDIENAILSQSNSSQIGSIKCIMVTESYFGDVIKLPLVFNHIKNMFGYLPIKSIVVLLTKKNLLAYEKGAQNKRKAIISKLESEYSIPSENVVDFMTHWDQMPYIKVEPNQYQILQDAINRCQPIQSESINEKYSKIQQLAKKIQTEITKKQTKIIEYLEDQLEVVRLKKQHISVIWRPYPIIGILGFGSTQTKNTPYHEDVVNKKTVKKNKQVEEKIVPDIDDCYKLALARFEMEMLENTNKNEEL